MSLRHASGVQEQLPAASFYGNPRVGYPHRQHLVRGASRCVSHLGYTSPANMKRVLKWPKNKQVLQHRLEALLPNLLFLFGRWGIPAFEAKRPHNDHILHTNRITDPPARKRPNVYVLRPEWLACAMPILCLCNFQNVYLFVQFFCFVTLY